MKEKMKRLSAKFRMVFGYLMMISLFAGSLLALLFLAALLIGGETAAAIAAFAYKIFARFLIVVTSVGIMIGLLSMYLNGDTALTPEKRRDKIHPD